MCSRAGAAAELWGFWGITMNVTRSGTATRNATAISHRVSDGHYVQEGRIAIIVLHDLTFAARWADNIVVMADGKPEYIGAPSDSITSHMLAPIYGVAARVERCTRGFLQVMVDRRAQ